MVEFVRVPGKGESVITFIFSSGIGAKVMGSNPKGVVGGGDCWQIRGLAVSINSPCVRRGRLGECTISLGYAPFLTAIAFRRFGSASGPTKMLVHTYSMSKLP